MDLDASYILELMARIYLKDILLTAKHQDKPDGCGLMDSAILDNWKILNLMVQELKLWVEHIQK